MLMTKRTRVKKRKEEGIEEVGERDESTEEEEDGNGDEGGEEV